MQPAILVDDLGYMDVGAFNPGSFYETPNIDELAKQGMLFRNSFCTNSICTPSRASILTGQYSHRNGVYDLYDTLPGERHTLPREMGKAGYACAVVGKWHLTKDSEQNDAADRSSWPCQRGFDRYYGDEKVTPNPCLAPIADAPFYCLEAYPGELGTKGGIRVDAKARALAEVEAERDAAKADFQQAVAALERAAAGLVASRS